MPFVHTAPQFFLFNLPVLPSNHISHTKTSRVCVLAGKREFFTFSFWDLRAKIFFSLEYTTMMMMILPPFAKKPIFHPLHNIYILNLKKEETSAFSHYPWNNQAYCTHYKSRKEHEVVKMMKKEKKISHETIFRWVFSSTKRFSLNFHSQFYISFSQLREVEEFGWVEKKIKSQI